MSDPASNRVCLECGLKLPFASSGCPGCSLRLALSPEAMTSGEAKQPLPPPGLPSRFFGDYEILGEIARGGMGVVYRARQMGLNRLVALKMVQSNHLLSDEARLRFRVEIEAVAQLHHPHIVALFESGEHAGAHYFTMRLVEGGDLSTQVKNRSLRERVQMLVKVCRAVHYAHQRGILHRDLKPSNVLVDLQGEPHVADFGLAKSLDQDSGFTFTSSVLGSPNYMAPEQAAGKTRQLTTGVDVYGLGAILYHLLTGEPPFQAKTPIETLRQVVDQNPVSPRSLDSRVDPDLETIALQCLRKEPEARYGTAEELAQDLERWLDGRPIRARPLGPIAVVWRWSRRHPVAAALSVALVVALAAIAGGSSLAVIRIREADQRSAASLRESLLREAGSFRIVGELGHRTEALRLIKEAAALGGSEQFRSRARNELLATLARTDLEFVPWRIEGLTKLPEAAGINPRYDFIAGVIDDTNVIFRGFTNDASRGRLNLKEPVTRIGPFGGNGHYVAMWHKDVLVVRDLRTGKRCFSRVGTNSTIAFHPREEAMLVQESPNEAVWLDLPSGQERHRWKALLPRPAGRTNGWHTLAFSPDGQVVAGASGTSLIVELMDPRTGNQIGSVTNITSHPVTMAWNRDGRLLAVATYDGRINLWEPKSRHLLWSSPAMIAAARSLAFQPRGNLLAAACEDDVIRLVDVAAERFVFEHAGNSRLIGFSSDGGRLGPVQWRGDIGYLEFRRPQEFTGFIVTESPFRLTDVRFSADGKLLATGHSDHVMVCESDGGIPLRSQSEWRMSASLFHPNGRDLLVGEARGLLRYQPRFTPSNRLTFGPKEIVSGEEGWQALDISPDGRFFAAFNVRSQEAMVFDQTLTNCLATVDAPWDTSAIAVSPDGRWLAASSRFERGVKVWELAEQKVKLIVSAAVVPRSAFSADGRWLAVTDEDKFELLETGSWKSAPTLPFDIPRPILGAAAFSPDSGTLAVVVNRFSVYVFDLKTFVLRAILRPPISAPIRGLAFAPDGSRLAAAGSEARVSVWNLHRLNARLAEFGLSWESPYHF